MLNNGLITDLPCVLRASANADTVTVYRSLLVRDGDRVYRHVAEFLAEHGATLRCRHTLTDESMLWGQAALSVFDLAA
jgi:hypothetical protein